METNKNWYAIYTRSGSEKKVADLLGRKKIVNYCPTCHHVQHYQGKTRISSVSLFTTMIFVFATEPEHCIIKQTEGVLGLLFWLQKPAIIDKSEIDAIRYFLQQYNDVQLEKIKIGTNNELNAEAGNASFITDYKTIAIAGKNKVYLHSLGYALTTGSIGAQIKSVA